MANALESLTGALNQFAGVAENTSFTLDETIGPLTVPFGKLGAFAEKIDRSAQRSYVETGLIQNFKPRQAEILMQEPDMTIVVKKRMFSSLIENYKPELMDYQDKLFYRASKKLFQNKCQAIAAFERLTKVDKIVKNTGVLNSLLFPVVFSAFDTLSSFGTTLFDNKTRAVMATLKKVQSLSEPNFTTTWITESELPAISDLGDGTGTFEITCVTNMSTSVSTKFAGGGANFTVEDPYALMIITNNDIDRAIRESYGGFLNNAFFKITEVQLERTIDDLRTQLSEIRRARGATAIRFIINEDAFLFKKVRAIIDEEGREILFNFDGGFVGIGSSVDIDSSAFDGANGLSSKNNETEIFKQILSNVYTLMASKKTTTVNNFEFNKETNYVRKNMLLHYGNKAIIQPKDEVHIFLNSKSLIDAKSAAVVATSFQDISNGLNKAIGQLENTIENLEASFDGAAYGQSYSVIEKDTIAGPDFPMWLWNLVKNDFTRQAAGTHVFGGFVDGPVIQNYNNSSGTYTVAVTCVDNCEYLNQGQININPSSEVFNSAIYDPLTPFDLDFNAASGFLNAGQPPLLPENRLLLNSGLVKFKNGPFRGYPANEQIYNSFDVEKIRGSGKFRRKNEDPDGFMYRWKRGIQTVTIGGSPHPTGELPSDRGQNLFKDPFAGQDVMNVLSLLVTGLPYNFNTFMKAAVDSGGFTRDNLLNDSSSSSFFKGLLSDISKTNATWGNFVPFKKLILNDSAYTFLLSGQFDLTTTNRQLTQKLQERARKFDQLSLFAPELAKNPQYLNVSETGQLIHSSELISGIRSGFLTTDGSDKSAVAKLASDVLSLDFEVEQLKESFQKRIQDPALNNANGSVQIFGNDISYENISSQTPSEIARQKSDFRKKINYLTQRRLWKVKANEDSNFFIVDDSYDKNYDIQAFEKTLGSLELYNSTYTSPGEQVQIVAKLLGLEVFCDSQGHIQVRPPQYNRMPSSVFYNMIKTKELTGIQLFPVYLENLFINQIKGLSDKISILEDEIRLRTTLMGYANDSAASRALTGFVAGGGAGAFAFVTDEEFGKFGGKDFKVLLGQVDPDLTGQEAAQQLKAIGTEISELKKNVQTASSSKVNFDIVQRVNIFNSTAFPISSDIDTETRLNKVANRLQELTGTPANTIVAKLLPNTKTGDAAKSQVDIVNLTEQISQFLSERQSALKLMNNSLKNLEEGISLNSSDEPGMTLLQPYLNRNEGKTFPEIIDHMIEDENFDDFGYGSGKRFIIRDNQILNMQIKETPPPFTSIEVNGLFDANLGREGSDVGFEIGGGNALSTAFAVDFDMWRMYGFKQGDATYQPTLSNADTQCAPYAVFLLNQARENIFTATLEIAGNEFIQAGEVYYIESRNLLFYAESVDHNYSYGDTFTTSINGTFGHNPGEYIPTILDIIGKGLYTNKLQGDLARSNRHGNSSGDVHLGCVIFDGFEEGADDPVKSLVNGSYGDQNRKQLANVLLAASGALTPKNSGQSAKIEIRVYCDSDNGFPKNDIIFGLADSIKSWLVNPTKTNISDGELLPDNNVDEVNNVISDSDKIEVVLIDLANRTDNDPRSPSLAAIGKAREIASTSGTPRFDAGFATANFPEKERLFLQVIDIWLAFESVPISNEVNLTEDQQRSEAAQKAFSQVIADFKKKLEVS